jgi:hypothetical protein
LFAGWGEHHGKQGSLQAGEDMCGCSRKVARFEIVRRMDFSNNTYKENTFTFIYTDYQNFRIYFFRQRIILENIIAKKKV